MNFPNNPSALSVRSLAASVLFLFVLAGLLTLPNQAKAASAPAAQIQKTFDLDGGYIQTSVEKDGIAYVAGPFTSIDGQQRNGLAAVRLSDGSVTDWNPLGPGQNVQINTMVINGDNLLIGGSFASINGETRNSLAEINLATGALTPFDVAVENQFQETDFSPGTVSDLDLHDGVLSITGDFTQVNRTNHSSLARVDLRTETPTVLNQPIDLNNEANRGLGYKFERLGNVLYIAGAFNSIGGVQRKSVAAINDNGEVLPFDAKLFPDAANNQIVPPITALAVQGTTVFIGFGEYSLGPDYALPGGHKGVAAFDASTGAVSDWNTDVTISNGLGALPQGSNGAVRDLVVKNDVLYIGGLFDTVRGQSGFNGIAAVDLRNNNLVDTSAFKVPNDFEPAAPRIAPYFAYINPVGDWLLSTFAVYSVNEESGVNGTRIYSSLLAPFTREGESGPSDTPIQKDPPKIDPPKVDPPVEIPTEPAEITRVLLKTNGKFRFYASNSSTAQVWIRRKTRVDGKLVYRDRKVLKDVKIRKGGNNLDISKYISRQGTYRIVIRDSKVGEPKSAVERRITKVSKNKFRLKKL